MHDNFSWTLLHSYLKQINLYTNPPRHKSDVPGRAMSLLSRLPASGVTVKPYQYCQCSHLVLFQYNLDLWPNAVILSRMYIRPGDEWQVTSSRWRSATALEYNALRSSSAATRSLRSTTLNSTIGGLPNPAKYRVPCPICGNMMKPTSLNQHIKRFHP